MRQPPGKLRAPSPNASSAPLPQRKWLRLRDWDYRSAGAYFVTICTDDHACLFGHIEDGAMVPSECGKIVQARMDALPRTFPDAEVDCYVVMPNHVHAVIALHGEADETPPADGATVLHGAADEALSSDGATKHAPSEDNASSLQVRRRGGRGEGTKAGSLGAIVQNLKSVSTRKINQFRKTPGSVVWQLNYYEHIVRDERELQAIRQYIADNPAAWEEDAENPERIRRPGRRDEAFGEGR